MPAALDVDWGQIQMLARDMGARAAARQMGLDEDTVLARCRREGWFREARAIAANPNAALPASMQPKTVALTARSVAEIHKKAVAELGGRTRFQLAKGIEKGSRAVANLKANKVLAEAGNIGALVKAAAGVHGWRGAESSVSLRLDVIAGMRGGEQASIDVESSVEMLGEEPADEL